MAIIDVGMKSARSSRSLIALIIASHTNAPSRHLAPLSEAFSALQRPQQYYDAA
jgi:hypothetical protein